MNKNKVFFNSNRGDKKNKNTQKSKNDFLGLRFFSSIKNFFNKSGDLSKKKDRTNRFNYTSSKKPKEESKTKIFKPNKSNSTFNQSEESKFKSSPNLQNSFSKLNKKTFTQYINFFIFKFKIAEKFNLFVSLFVISIISLFLFYLVFFDIKFLVKDYEVVFDDSCMEQTTSFSLPENCSYLDEEETLNVLRLVKENNFLYIIPNNNFWFLNGKNLTESVRSRNQEVTSIDVVERNWPNRAKLKITTKPILITLGINNSEYWRVAQNGDVVSKDDIGLRERLVVVESRVDFDKPGADLGDFSFEKSRDQLNRFWFIIWLWQKLEENDIEWVKTSIPTLFDSDVIITTRNNTRLYFDYNSMSRENQTQRIEWIFNDQSSVKQAEAKGIYKYLDFRQKNRVFLCRYGQECAG